MLLDTGAEHNFISQKLLNKLTVQPIEVQPLKVETADGRVSTLDKAVKIEIKIKGMEHVVFKTMAYILSNSNTEVIMAILSFVIMR